MLPRLTALALSFSLFAACSSSDPFEEQSAAGGAAAGAADLRDIPDAPAGMAGAEPGEDDPRDPPWLSVEQNEPVGAEEPLTCDALEDNCWADVVDAALACSPQGEGVAAKDGLSCEFPDGSRVLFSSAIETPEGFFLGYRFSVVGADGKECISQSIDDWADFSLRSPGGTVSWDSLSWASYRLICQDGRTLTTQSEAACDEINSLTVDRAPSFLLSGSKQDDGSYLLHQRVGGGSSGQLEALWTCRFPAKN